MSIKQFAFITVLFLVFGCGTRNSEAQAPLGKNTNLQSLDATKLLSIYIDNPSDGDKLYKGKEIVIVGRVWDVSKDKQTLLLDYRNGEGYGVLCISNFKKLFNEIKTGENVKVRGICQGMSNKHIKIADCSVLENW